MERVFTREIVPSELRAACLWSRLRTRISRGEKEGEKHTNTGLERV